MDGNEDQTAKRFSMRIQLRPKTAVEAEPVKKKAKTGAERARLFRERRAADSVRQAEYLQVERERSRQRRTNMSDEQRKLYNASAALRNAKSRAKKRQQKTNSTPQSTPTRRSSRLDGKDLKTKREKERQRVQKYRDNMTPQKRRRVNEKRMRRYYAVKERRVVEKAAQQQASRSITEGPKTTKRSDKLKVNLKEDILSGGSKVLSVLRMILQGKGEAKQRLEEFGLTYADDKPLLTALEKTKKKRDVDTLKMRGFIARTVKNVKKKYYQLGFDSRTIKKSREKLSLYKKESKFKPVISKFFEDHSVHLPGMKTVSKKSLSQKKILQSPVTELFKEFRNENPACRVSLKTFFRHRPKHVLSCTKTPLEQCKCEICLNPSLKLRAFNKLTGQQLQLKDLMDKTLCPSTNKFHKLGCLQRSCINCDPSAAFEVLSQEYDVTKFITWEKWDYVSTDNKKHLEKLERQGSLNDLICELCKELKTLPQHIFTYRWQAEQYKLLKALPPKDCAVCTFDFAQNYVCTSQDQPQSSFYGMKQITVHPVVIHRQCPVECGGIITDNIVFFSDDLKHDPYFVQDVTTTIVRFLKKVGVTRAFVFSDGASSQYKAKLPFSLITSIQGFKIERHFFGSRHGKSACDALGGVIKTAARQAVATRSVTIGNAKELFEFCRGSLSIQVESCCGSNRSFHLVTAIARPKSDGSTLKTVPGTRKIHSLIPLAPNVIATRNLSCFCQHCLAEDYVNCVNADYVSSWDKIKLSNASPNVFEALGEISERDSFFMEAQKIMCSCSNFQELQRAALKVSELMAQFSLTLAV